MEGSMVAIMAPRAFEINRSEKLESRKEEWEMLEHSQRILSSASPIWDGSNPLSTRHVASAMPVHMSPRKTTREALTARSSMEPEYNTHERMSSIFRLRRTINSCLKLHSRASPIPKD